MSIRPLDMQVMVPKSTEISHIKHIEQQKSNNEQFQFGIMNEKKNDHNQQHVVKTDENEKLIFQKNKKNKNAYTNNKKKKKEKKENDNKQKNIDHSMHIDIKI